GGGAATASMINFNRTLNDNNGENPHTLTFRNTDNELLPGRFIYDQAHWRTEFKQFKVNNGKLKRYLGRYERPMLSTPRPAPPPPPPYATLPIEISLKTAATDPFPPNRASAPTSNFYQTQFDVEFISAANDIQEDIDPGANDREASVLDTVYKVVAPAT